MKILLLSPMADCSGNNTTISRLRGHFERNGYKCELTSPESYSCRDVFLTFVQNGGFHLILAIHAYKSGFLLRGCKVPYMLILGGTDVNQCTDDPGKMAVMTEAIQTSKHIVCFGTSLQQKFFEKWPDHNPNSVSIIPQAVLAECSDFNIKKYIQNNIQAMQPVQNLNLIHSTVDKWDISKEKSTCIGYWCDSQNPQDLTMQSHDFVDHKHSARQPHDQSHDNVDHKHSSRQTHDQSHDIMDHKHSGRQSHDQSHDIMDHKHSGRQSHDQSHDIMDHKHSVRNAQESQNVLYQTLDEKHKKSGIFRDELYHSHHGNRPADPLQRHLCDKFEDAFFFTIVGGIRPVKDQLYLVEEFQEWARRKEVNCYLLIIGPKMDEEYFCQFKNKISSKQNVIYIPGLSLQDTHTAIRDSFALVNTSLSEGMAISILEAMCVNTPVIVRDIPGNRTIVEDKETGLLYNTPQDFFQKADRLIVDSEEVVRLTSNAKKYILHKHSMQKEEEAYIKLAQRTCDTIYPVMLNPDIISHDMH